MSSPNFQSPLVLRREALNLTQAQIAERIGVTTRTVSYWENGTHMPKLDPIKMAALCELLGFTIQELAAIFSPAANSQN